MSEPLLNFEEITYGYDSAKTEALRSLSLTIPAGSITAILGPNGAGKTTLLRLALGWLHPQKGRIELAGLPLRSYSRRELGRWMALVPQSEYIPFEYSLLEYVLLGRTPYLHALDMPGEADYQIARSALEQVGLGGRHNQSILKLSGGERQLVLVGRALAQQPRLLLLDEPTSHLDLSNKSHLLGLLRRLSAQGVTILFTTHEPELAAALANQLVLMRSGQVLQAGPLPDIFNSAALSQAYGVPVQVVEAAGRKVVIWE